MVNRKKYLKLNFQDKSGNNFMKQLFVTKNDHILQYAKLL